MKQTVVNFNEQTKIIKTYEKLLRDCLHAFNELPRQKVGNTNTYVLATRIESNINNLRTN